MTRYILRDDEKNIMWNHLLVNNIFNEYWMSKDSIEILMISSLIFFSECQSNFDTRKYHILIETKVEIKSDYPNYARK